MPKATLLSSYNNKSRSFSLVIGKAMLLFKSGQPKTVSPSVAVILSKKTEAEKDHRGKATGKRRNLFSIEDMPEVKNVTSVRRKDDKTGQATTGTVAKRVSGVKGQRKIG